MARTDGLTGILNSRAFYEELGREIERSKRTGDPFVVAFIDLDHFKTVNDSLGHPVGDKLLHSVASAIEATLRAIDTVARIGGDEMALLLPETDLAAAGPALKRVAMATEQAIGQVDGVPDEVGITMGAVVFVEPPQSADVAIREADDLMYEGKQAGRGQTRLRAGSVEGVLQ
jgi:diguanylate cyclase (GGDEF)-like protein